VNSLTGILRNSSLLAAAYVISTVIATAVMVLVSRTLGDVEFGRLHLALTLTTIVGVVVDFGLSQVVTRAVARERGLARPYLIRAAIVVALLGGSLYFVLLGSTQVLGYSPEVRTLVLILGLLMLAEGFAQIIGALFQSHEQMAVPALTRVAGNALTLTLVVPLLMRGYGAAAVAVVMVLGAALRVGLNALAVRRLNGFQRPAPRPPSWPELLRAGLPFLAAQGLGMFVVRVDVMMLGRMADEATIGWYGASTRLVEAFNFIPLVITMATFPVLSRLWVSDRAEFHATVRKTLDLMLVMSVPVTVTLVALADDIVSFLFTLDSFGPTVPILRVQALSYVMVFVDYLLVCVIMAMGRERLWIAIVAGACVLNPAMNLFLIPAAEAQYANGAIGSALATFLTEVYLLALSLRVVPSGTFGRGSRRVAAQAWALGGLLATFLLVSRPLGVPWVLAAAAGLAAYVAAVIWLRILPPDVMVWARGLILRRVRRTATADIPSAAMTAKSDAAPTVDAA
jgi:O-antigen/teichoic acid export membrane protein